MSRKQYAISCYPWFTQRGRILDSKGNALADVRYAANQIAPGNVTAMAAAPEMLEALRVIAISLGMAGTLHAARQFLDDRGIPNDNLEGDSILLKVAATVITAATGEKI